MASDRQVALAEGRRRAGTAPARPWALDRIRLLQALTPDQRRRLAPAVEAREVRRGDRIYGPGDPALAVWAVTVGVVRLSTVSADDREVILAFVGQGDLFGELAVVDGAPRDHAAHAHEDGLVCAIDRAALDDCIRQAPEIGYQIARVLGARVRTLRNRIEELLCRSAQARVARAITELAETHGIRDAGGVLIPLRLSQRDLAGLAALSRETVNAVLQDFRARDLVETGRHHIRLLQPEKLLALR